MLCDVMENIDVKTRLKKKEKKEEEKKNKVLFGRE